MVDGFWKDHGLSEDVLLEALEEIKAEDVRQRKKFGNQYHSSARWFLILAEEVGELAKAILEDEDPQLVIAEALQVTTLVLKISQMARAEEDERQGILRSFGYGKPD